MKIVDPHFHIWDLSQLSYPWLTTGPVDRCFLAIIPPYGRRVPLANTLLRAGPFTLQKLSMSKLQLRKGRIFKKLLGLNELRRSRGSQTQLWPIVIYQARPPKQNWTDSGEPHVCVVYVKFWNTHDDELLNFAPQEFMENDLWLEGFELLSARDLSFDMQIYPSQMAAAAQLARQNNGTRIVLNHTGMPLGHDPASFNAWRAAMSELSLCDNVSVKISGLGMMFHDWTTEMIRPFVRETIKLFGADRCMFASNFPVDSMFSTFETLWTAYRDIVSDLSSAEQDKVFHQTAERIYRI